MLLSSNATEQKMMAPPDTDSIQNELDNGELDNRAVLGCFFLAIAFALIYYYYSNGNHTSFRPKCCAWGRGNLQRDSSGQSRADRVAAEETQGPLKKKDLARRKERRMWYEYYMKPYSVVIKKSYLFYAVEGEYNSEESSKKGQLCREIDDPVVEVERDIQQLPNKHTAEFSDSDDEETGECFEKQNISSGFGICDQCDENATLYANLPVVAGDEKNVTRCVDGSCALCLEDYAEGDIVVWSDLNCSHAFHKECLMQWLCKGKKHCPVCRNWFVPAVRIEDQKIAHGEAWKRALGGMT